MLQKNSPYEQRKAVLYFFIKIFSTFLVSKNCWEWVFYEQKLMFVKKKFGNTASRYLSPEFWRRKQQAPFISRIVSCTDCTVQYTGCFQMLVAFLRWSIRWNVCLRTCFFSFGERHWQYFSPHQKSNE